MEEQSTHFICITHGKLSHQWKQNGSVLLTNKRCTKQFEQTQTLPMCAKYMGHTANIAKNHRNFKCDDGETIHMFLLYDLPMEAYNGTVLTTEAHIKQLEQNQISDQRATVSLGWLKLFLTRCVPGFLKLFFKKCVCFYVCIFVCLYFGPCEQM